MTKGARKGVKVDPVDRVTLPVKFACKQELTGPLVRVTLAEGVTLSPRSPKK